MSSIYPQSTSTSMKTYSKRVNLTLANSSKKRKREDEIEIVETVPELPKATRPRTMLDFFKPKVTVTTSACPSSSGVSGQDDISSDSVDPTSTPPSSPPPVKARASEGTGKAQHKARRRLGARPSLPSFSAAASDDDDENTSSKDVSKGKEREKESESSKRATLKPTRANLSQRQLDLGISAMKHCRDCGMDYNSTLPEDRKLHDEYHKRKLHLHLKPSSSSRQSSSIKSSLSISTTINGQTHETRTLDARGPVTQRKEFEDALDLMYHDLPGEEITLSDLWSEIANPTKSSVQNNVSRFAIFTTTVDGSPAAVLIVERVSHGGGYLDDYHFSPPLSSSSSSSQTQAGNPSSENQARFKAYPKPDIILPASMSVERIWVAEAHRRHGLATRLIDHARKTLIPGIEIKRNQVAFSWPTALGRGLAMKYSMGVFEDAIPFLVNLKDCPGMDG